MHAYRLPILVALLFLPLGALAASTNAMTLQLEDGSSALPARLERYAPQQKPNPQISYQYSAEPGRPPMRIYLRDGLGAAETVRHRFSAQAFVPRADNHEILYLAGIFIDYPYTDLPIRTESVHGTARRYVDIPAQPANPVIGEFSTREVRSAIDIGMKTYGGKFDDAAKDAMHASTAYRDGNYRTRITASDFDVKSGKGETYLRIDYAYGC